MKTATLVKDNIEGFRGRVALYKLSEAHEGYKYVICSSSTDASIFGLETFIFGANGRGEVLDCDELYGSKRDTEDHEEVLNAAGYEVVIEPS